MTAAARLHTVRLCAAQELLLAMRSRWMQLFAAVFSGLAVAVAAAGYVMSGGSGIQDFARTSASLLQLVLLIVPLAALMMGVLALTPERGGAELLFSQPIDRRDVLAGTVLGLFAALVLAQALGFGAAGLVVATFAGQEGGGAFVSVMVASAMLTAVFLALAALVSAGQTGRRRIHALATALILWLCFAFAFDIAALAAASLLRSGHASRLLITAVLANPIDAVRTGALLAIEGTGAFGAASLALFRFSGGPERAALLLAASVAFWTLVPLALAGRRLRRMDIV